LRVVICAARIYTNVRAVAHRIAGIVIVDDKVGQPEQLQTCRPIALSLGGHRATEVAKPDVQDELGPSLRHVRRECAKQRIVEPVREVCF
jgi:hypothetical protein